MHVTGATYQIADYASAGVCLERPSIGSLQAAGGGAGGPAVVGSCVADESTDGDERGGEVEEEVHDAAVAVGAAAELAVAVHPRVGAFADPSCADLDWCGYAFAGDLTVQAEPVEQGSGDGGVVADVEVDGELVGPVRADLGGGRCEGGAQQR